jgi:hypothetical protein
VVNSVLNLLHRVNMGNVADVAEVHTASIFTVEIFKKCEFPCIYSFVFLKKHAEMKSYGGGNVPRPHDVTSEDLNS